MPTQYNPFAVAQQQLDKAAAQLNLDSATHTLLREPQKEVHVTFPVKMDDGSTQIFKGFRVQYNTARGPAKGGLRWHETETIDTVRALAAWMTWKTSALDLPLGGGKGGVICNSHKLSVREKELVARGFIRGIAKDIDPCWDVPAPDVGTTPQIMLWMLDEYEAITGKRLPGIITGKPVGMGGSLGRGDATSRGGCFVLRDAAKAMKFSLNGKTAVIQGFGNAGQYAATLCTSLFDMKITAVSKSDCAIINKKGLDIPKLVEYYEKTNTIKDFPGAEPLNKEEILLQECDVLIPAALEGVITEKNADKIKTKYILELANGPTTPEADAILNPKGIVVLPDFLANAGGVTVSYFEQVQNAYNYYWEIADVHKYLEMKMSSAFKTVYEMSQTKKVSLREAAFLVAVTRVADACKMRGWV